MKLNKYITAAAIVLAVAVIVGFGQVTRENMASHKPKEIVIQVGEGGGHQFDAPEGGNIAEITFGSYGTPIVDRNSKPKVGSCHADIRAEVSRRCSGQTRCTIWARNDWFGDPCPGTVKKMVIGYTVYDPNAEAKAKEEEEAAATAKAEADAAAKAKADATAQAAPADTSKTKSADTPKTKSDDTSTTTPEPAATSTAAPDNTMMYVALGMGALVLVLGVFMLVSRPSPAPVVAGRRRR
jgi:hypothetical protein